MTDIVRVTEATGLYTGLREGHTEAEIEQAVEALIHRAKTEYGASFSFPLTLSPCVPSTRLIKKDGFTARYTQMYDIEADKLVTRLDMIIPTATEPA